MRGLVPVGVETPEVPAAAATALLELIKLLDFFFCPYLSLRRACGSDNVGAKNFRPLELPVESERFKFCDFLRRRICSVVTDACEDVAAKKNCEFYFNHLQTRKRISNIVLLVDGVVSLVCSVCIDSWHSGDVSFFSTDPFDVPDVMSVASICTFPSNPWFAKSCFIRASFVARRPAISEFCCF